MHTSEQPGQAPGVIDVESMLRPIDDTHPAGRDLADEDEYHLIREARRAEVGVALQDDDFDTSRRLFRRPEPKSSDWPAVVRLGREALGARTKDLQIAAWVTEALGQLHGFKGLRDGFRLLLELQERYWSDLYPRLEPGDPESRFGPYDFLNSEKILPTLIRSIPMSMGGAESYTYSDYVSLKHNDELLRKNPEVARDALRGPNKIVSEDWERAVAQTSRGFYEGRAAELTECLEAFDAWDQSTIRLFPRGSRGQSCAPTLSNIRQALAGCQDLVVSILEARPMPAAEEEANAPDAGSDSTPVDEPPPTESGDGDGRADGFAMTTRAAREPDRPGATWGPIADRHDADRRLLEIVRFLKEDDPDDPVPYLLVRARRIGEAYASAEGEGDAGRPGPRSEVRQELRRLIADEEWDEALELAEQALGGPEGRAWLDAHRYAIQALEAEGRQTAALACRSLLRMFLDDFPDLPGGELDDGTPAADARTRLWLEGEGLLRSTGKRTEPVAAAPTPPPPPPAADDGPIDIDARAAALADAGRGAEAIELLDRATVAAASGRERFLHRLRLAEICLRLGNDQVALPILEDLERQIDHFRLEDWEDRASCARVVGALHHCLKARGAGERLQQVYARLCRLDVRRAMRDGPGTSR